MTRRPPGSRRRALVDRLLQTAQKLPGAERVQARAEQAERLLVRELKARLDRLTDEERMLPAQANGDDPTQSLRQRMAQLMARNADQSREAAMAELCARILDQLLPDEARILGALSDGSSQPVIHVGIGGRVGPPTEFLRRFVSDIGKPARLRLPEYAPMYLARLAALDLIETGPEDASLDLKYQVLESDRQVRLLTAQIDPGWARAIRFQRRTVRLSAFGHTFWSAVGPK